MTTTIKTTHRALVALSLPKPVPALILYAQNVVTRMKGNALFPNAVPQLATVTARGTTLGLLPQGLLLAVRAPG